MPKSRSAKQKVSERHWDDSDWAIANAQMLSQNYPNEWVAIYEKQVIAHDKSLNRVMSDVGEKGVNNPVFKFSERGIRVYKNSIAIRVSI